MKSSNYKNIIIKRENGNMVIIRKDSTHLLALQIVVSSTCSLGGHLQFTCPWHLHKKYAIELQHVTK